MPAEGSDARGLDEVTRAALEAAPAQRGPDETPDTVIELASRRE